MHRSFKSVVAVIPLLLLIVPSNVRESRAQSASWLNDADGVWSLGTNWVGGVPASGAGNTATFSLNNTALRTITLDGSFTIGNLGFNDTGANGDLGWVIAGGPTDVLTLSVLAGTPTITTTSPLGQASATISAILAGNQGLTKNGVGRLILTGTNTLTGGVTIAAGVLRATPLSIPSGNLTLNGGGIFESSGTLTKNLGTGAPDIRFLGNGGFSAAGGDLTVSLNGGTTLVWNSTTGFLTNNTLVLGATLSDSLVELQNGLDFNGTSRTIQVDGDAVINARISGNLINSAGSPAGFTKSGAGVLELTGINTYNGGTTISAGVLRISGSGLSPSSNVALNGGILELGGSYTPNLGTGAGELRFTGGANNGGFAAAGSPLTVNLSSGAMLVWNSTPNFLGTGNLLFGSASADDMVAFQNPLDLGGATRTVTLVNTPATVDARLSGAVSNGGLQITGVNSVVFEMTGANTYAGPTTVTNATWRLTGDAATALASYTGNIALSSAGGGQTAVLQTSGTINRTIGAGANQIRIIGSAGSQGFAATNSNLTLQLAALQWGAADFFPGASTGVFNLSSATAEAMTELQSDLDLNTAATRSVVVKDNTSSAADFGRISGAVTSSIPGGTLIKTGTGLLELTGSGNNTHWRISAGAVRADGTSITTGNLAINGGVFESTGNYNAVLGTGAGQVQFTASGGFSAAGSQLTVNLNGGSTLTWGTVSSFVQTGTSLIFGSTFAGSRVVFNNPIDLNAATRTFTVNDNPNSTADVAVLAGVVSGTGNSRLLKNGAGTLILSADNTYAGGTTVNAGTLQIGDGGTTGSIVGNVIDRALLAFSRSDTYIYAGVISNTGGVAQLGPGTTVLIGANTYSGGTSIVGGTLQIGNNGTTGAIVGNVDNRGVLAFSRSDVPVFAGVISGTGAVLVNGTGGVELTGSNSYSGTTTIASGTLRLSGNAATAFFNSYTGNLSLNSGVGQTALLQTSGTLNRSVGTGSSQVHFAGTDGIQGFAATNSDLVLQLGMLQWASLDFFFGSNAALGLSSATSTAVTELQSDLDINTIFTRTITVADNAASTADRARLSGSITSQFSSGWILKNGAGVLEFTGVNNTVGLQIEAGTVRASGSALTTGNITLSGGVLESSGTFTRPFGASSNEVRWFGAGGFSAVGGGLTVNLDLDANPSTNDLLTWGSGVFVPTGSALIFGSAGATDRVEFANRIAIANANRTVTVNDNPNLTTDYAVISGTISGNANGRITKNGAGLLVLSGNNSYGGITAINAGTLQIGDGGTTGSVAGGITNNTGLIFNRSNDITYAGVITGAGGVTKLGSGSLILTGTNTYTGTTTVIVGTLVVATGGQINGAGGVRVASGAGLRVAGSLIGNGNVTVAGVLNVSGTLGEGAALISVDNGGLLIGGGTLHGTIDLHDGGLLSPGVGVAPSANGAGTLNVDGTAAPSIWAGGSTLYFDFTDATGVAGVDWDLVNFGAGSLNITATAANRITLRIAANLSATNFDTALDADLGTPGIQPVSYLWKFADATDLNLIGVGGLSDRFLIDDSGVFGNGAPFAGQRPVSSLGSGQFYVTNIGSDLYVGYSSVPEPGSWLLGLLAAGGWYRMRVRRRYARISRTTRPWTSVSRKSRPP